jgi:hypothetical protein
MPPLVAASDTVGPSRSRLSSTWPTKQPQPRSCTVRLLLTFPVPRNWQTWVASLSSTFPLLAQEVLELLYQLLRVEVFVTQGARRFVHRRVIVLL